MVTLSWSHWTGGCPVCVTIHLSDVPIPPHRITIRTCLLPPRCGLHSLVLLAGGPTVVMADTQAVPVISLAPNFSSSPPELRPPPFSAVRTETDIVSVAGC